MLLLSWFIIVILLGVIWILCEISNDHKWWENYWRKKYNELKAQIKLLEKGW